jgi:hypothetical protein
LEELVKKNDSLAISRQLVGPHYGPRDDIHALEYSARRRLPQGICPSESVNVEKYCVDESLKQESAT